MNGQHSNRPQLRLARRRQQEESLREKEIALQAVATQQDKQGFFAQITPLLASLKSYIKRRLIMACANGGIRTPLYTSRDLLDEVVLRAYENYDRKPLDLTPEQWLYRIANDILKNYIQERKFEARHRQSLERLRARELSTLEELPQLTADTEGEPWLAEDLDDAEWDVRDFIPPAYEGPEPEEQDRKARRKELLRILRALARLPESERVMAELFIGEGFSKEEVAKICDVAPDDVVRIAENAKRQVFPGIGSDKRRKT